MYVLKLKKLYSKYAEQPLFLRVLINLFLIFITHSSFEVFLKLSLFEYTSRYNSYFPSSEEFDIFIFFPYFYYNLFVMFFFSLAIVIVGYIASGLKTLHGKKEGDKSNSLRLLYKNFLSLRGRTRGYDSLFRNRVVFLSLIYSLPMLTLFLAAKLIGFNSFWMLCSFAVLSYLGYLAGIKSNRYYAYLVIPLCLATSVIIASSPSFMDRYLQRAGAGGDIKVLINLKNDKSISGYLILKSKKYTTILNKGRSSLITLRNSEIISTKVNKSDMRLIDPLDLYSKHIHLDKWTQRPIKAK